MCIPILKLFVYNLKKGFSGVPLEWNKWKVSSKEILLKNKNKGIRVSQLAEIPTLFLIGGDHWIKEKRVIILLYRKREGLKRHSA